MLIKREVKLPSRHDQGVAERIQSITRRDQDVAPRIQSIARRDQDVAPRIQSIARRDRDVSDEVEAATTKSRARLIPPMDLPSDDALRWIVSTYARLRAAHGDAIGAPVLVQPTATFFPDEFRGDAPGVARLLRRLVTYAPIADDLPLELAFFAEEHDPAGGCGSAACGPGGGGRVRAGAVEEVGDGYRVFVGEGDAGQPDVLTASLARSVGALVLGEAGEENDGDTASETAEIAAVACGFGVLLANGGAVWAKSCGGLRMARATALSVEETAVALALFVAVHGIPESEARAHLQATQREALDLALAWALSNPLVVGTLREHPGVLEAGVFDVEPARGLLGRWLHNRKLEKAMRPGPLVAKPAPSEGQRRRLEEARALVDEVFGGE